MRVLALLIGISLIISGCSGRNPPHEGMLTTLNCQQITVQLGEPITCISTDTGLLLQTIDEQVTLTTESAVISFDSTIFWSHADIEMFLMVLDGVGSLAAGDETRLLRAGYAVTINASPTLMTIGKPVEPFIPSRDTLVALPVHNLPRPIESIIISATDVPIIQPTSAPTAFVQPTATPDMSSSSTIQTAPISTTIPVDAITRPTDSTIGCNIPFDWDRVHLVQAGDTLFGIATQYEMDMADLIAGNCITNPDRLALNQEIRLPSTSQALQLPTVPPIETQFSAERDVIIVGDCVMLNWVASPSASVSLGGAIMASSGNQAVCPAQTQTYQLTVTNADGTQSTYSQTITVTE